MERYNLLLVETPVNMLQIVTTLAYAETIAADPGLIHDNYGDFFSEVPVRSLKKRIKETLKKPEIGLGGKIELVSRSQLKTRNVNLRNNPETNYIFYNHNGIWVYCPEMMGEGIDAPGSTDKGSKWQGVGYGMRRLGIDLLALAISEDLFSEREKGSLQLSVEEMEHELLNLSKRLKEESGHLKEVVEGWKREFKEWEELNEASWKKASDLTTNL